MSETTCLLKSIHQKWFRNRNRLLHIKDVLHLSNHPRAPIPMPYKCVSTNSVCRCRILKHCLSNPTNEKKQSPWGFAFCKMLHDETVTDHCHYCDIELRREIVKLLCVSARNHFSQHFLFPCYVCSMLVAQSTKVTLAQERSINAIRDASHSARDSSQCNDSGFTSNSFIVRLIPPIKGVVA